VSGRWHAALGYALTGEDLPVGEATGPDVPALVAELSAAGWPGERIAEHARARAAAGEGWPHQIPRHLRQGCGAAQLAAALGAARSLLGLTTLETRAPSGRTRLDADEQRLIREKPPHHGS
jgi:hypothetical protein